MTHVTEPSEKTLFRNVSILDSTGAEPYPGDVLVENDRIVAVGEVDESRAEGARVIEGNGRTLMSGLCDAHTHFSWNNSADLDGLGTMPVEEHLLFCLESARTYIDSGYTMCLGAASAKDRLDVVCRDAINSGRFPGPRYLANGPEIAVTGGALTHSITKFADGPEGMRKAVRELVALGVDQIKLSMTGEEITGTQRAEDTYFSDDEVAAAVSEAHRRGKRVCAHARSAESVKMCVRHGVDVIYHASFTDEEGMDMLEANKDWVWVAPGLNWLVATLYEAEAFGFPQEAAEAVGYKKELDIAVAGLREMHRRGVRILPGGDYGFAWTPHGTYARDLQHFVELLGFTPMEAILSATALGGELMMRGDELGKVQSGYLADLILVDGDPLADITVLQDQDKLHYIMKDGRFHKEQGDAPAPPPDQDELVTSGTQHVVERRP
ncbi:dipeptidase [Arsenicicoccus piscis]|uniref:Dipeptidase n=1 Tax=Arsenicicoccus piscis TaxID=673954 RepID=A0ABQ6HNJ5_9MICO|nr:dipeptidase [Arsenicicoccus piscis]